MAAIKCSGCKKVLLPENEGKTWAYFLKNNKPDCYECVDASFHILEHKIKRIR